MITHTLFLRQFKVFPSEPALACLVISCPCQDLWRAEGGSSGLVQAMNFGDYIVDSSLANDKRYKGIFVHSNTIAQCYSPMAKKVVVMLRAFPGPMDSSYTTKNKYFVLKKHLPYYM